MTKAMKNPPPCSGDVLILHPTGLYTDLQLKKYLGVGAQAWAKMKSKYGITYRKIGLRKVILGEDLLKMIQKPVVNPANAARMKKWMRRKKVERQREELLKFPDSLPKVEPDEEAFLRNAAAREPSSDNGQT